MADGSISYPRLKLSWADHHLDALESEIEAFKDSDPIPIGDDRDPKTGEKFWYVAGPPKEPSITLSLIAGDFLANLRASLDYLVWQLVLANGETPGRWNGFPLCSESKHWSSAINRNRMKGVSDQALTAIKEHQPCFGGNLYRNMLLLWLEDLAGTDSHRYTQLFSAGIVGGFWDRPLPFGVADDAVVQRGRAIDGAELARISRRYADVMFIPAIGVAFGLDGPAGNVPAREALIGVREMVKIIIEGFSHPRFGLVS